MDRHGRSGFHSAIDLDKLDQRLQRLDKLDERLQGMDSAIERLDSSLGRTITTSLRGYDPTLWKGMRLAEHKYLLDKKALMGIDQATRRGLHGMQPGWTAVPPLDPQLSQWAREFSTVAQQAGSILSKLDQFVGIIGGRMVELAAGASRFLDGIRAFEPIVGLSNMMSALPKVQDFDRFWDAIGPALEAFREMTEDIRDGDAALEAAEFGFADHLWNVFYMRTFAHLDPRVRDAVVTRKLAAYTSSDIFAEELREQIEASQLMGKRWRVIEPALEAHAARKYVLSVPVILAQIEGAVGDAMFLKDLAIKEGNKYYLCDEDGNFKRNKNGKRLPAITLTPAIKNAKLDEHANLAAASGFMADAMVQRRNDVMHGRDVAYGRAKFSVQALLILAILAQGVAELEDNGI